MFRRGSKLTLSGLQKNPYMNWPCSDLKNELRPATQGTLSVYDPKKVKQIKNALELKGCFGLYEGGKRRRRSTRKRTKRTKRRRTMRRRTTHRRH